MNKFVAILVVIAVLVPMSAAFGQDGGKDAKGSTPAAQPAKEPAKQPAPAAAKDSDSMFNDIEGVASVRAQFFSNLDSASKFLEYRDEPIGPVVDLVELRSKSTPDSDWFFNLRITDAAQKDARYGWDFGRYGKFKVAFTWDRIIHNYAFSGETIYGGVGTNHLKLPDQFQADVQAQTTAAGLTSVLQSQQESARDLESELFYQRDRVKLRTEYVAMDPLTFYTEFRYEGRDGQRPMGNSSNAFAAIEELPVPKDGQVWEVEFGVQYANDEFDAALAYTYSNYDAAWKDYTWDNPFRNTDRTLTFPAGPGFGPNTNGARIERATLEPDNRMHNISLTLGYNLPWWRTRLTAEVAANWRVSDEMLDPYTTNTAMTAGALSGGSATSPPVVVPDNMFLNSSIPDRQLNEEINTQYYTFGATTHPLEELDVRGVLRDRRQNDDSQKHRFIGFVLTDATFTPPATFAGPLANDRMEYDRWTGSLDANYRIDSLNSRVFGGWQYDGVSRDHRQVEDVDEHTARGGIETRWTKDLKSKLSYSQSWRTHGAAEVETAELPPYLHEDVDWANRIRYNPTLTLEWAIMDGLDLSTQYRFKLDDFRTNDLGTNEIRSHEVELDVDWVPSEAFSLTPFLSYVKSNYLISGRQWTANNIGDPYTREPGVDSPSNWFSEEKGDTYTVGLHTHYLIVPERLDLLLDYTFAWNRADVDFESPLGISALFDNNFRVPGDLNDSDNSIHNNLALTWHWTPSKTFNVDLGYMFDSFRYTSYYTDGLTPIPLNNTTTSGTVIRGAFNNGIFLNAKPEDADVHEVWVTGSYKF